jgi:hypothetical protein
MKYLFILLIPFLVACQEIYRYPCQDPDNWDKQMCNKPYCSANGTCPEDLRHYEKNVPIQNNNNNSVGRCS